MKSTCFHFQITIRHTVKCPFSKQIRHELFMHAASQLPGRGPTDVDDALAPAG